MIRQLGMSTLVTTRAVPLEDEQPSVSVWCGSKSRTLNRLARQHTGLSAKELIDERVVLEAKRQLSHADASVAEIAEQLGFDDASNFSAYFRRQTRMTPGTFRTRSRAGTGTASAP